MVLILKAQNKMGVDNREIHLNFLIHDWYFFYILIHPKSSYSETYNSKILRHYRL
jgi:hypothetical protein